MKGLKNILLALIAINIIILFIAGCGFNTPLSLQQKVRMFFYENQIEAGPKFVEWANKNLNEYTNKAIMEALLEEGKYHANLGHPNAIAVINFAAKNWANETHLRYNPKDWEKLREVAMSNLRSEPGEVQLWPTK